MASPFCSAEQHFSRRMLFKGALATASGAMVMNWGGLTGAKALADQARREGKHCILLWMNGGASQFETFDMKPGRPHGGPFRPISTNLPGVQICELMPKMSQMLDRVAVIRSMRTSEVDHPGGIYLMHTGYKRSAAVKYPDMGALIAKYHGNPEADLPHYIQISSGGGGEGGGAGFLGPAYQPFKIGSDGNLPANATSTLATSTESKRHDIRDFVEAQFAKDRVSNLANMHRETYEATRRLRGATDSFKIDAEWEKYRSLYGDSAFGRRCLLARRLVEEGVAFIEVYQTSYDSHEDNAFSHKSKIPPMEHAWAGLIQDLEQRGLLEKTLIVWTGEIGRTPRINNRAGRDHYVRAWSTALAGCGIKGGQVYGATDADGIAVTEGEVTEGDFFATIYKALGINPHDENMTGTRPIPVAPFGAKPVKALLA